MRHKKDCYLVCSPSWVPWRCVVGHRLVLIPADNCYRVFSLHGGKEYGSLAWMGEVSPDTISKRSAYARSLPQ